MHRNKAIWIIFLAGILVPDAFAGTGTFYLGPFHHQSLTGEVKLKGLYRRQKTLFNEVGDDQQSLYFIGGLKLNSRSYIWDPGIISFDLGVEVNPETRSEKFISIPDRSEVRTLNKFGAKTTIFGDKPVSLSAFADFHQSYFSRELLTDVRSNNRQWGGRLMTNNKVFPAVVTFRRNQWDQNEIQSGRVFRMDQSNLEGRISKTFAQHDRHELVMSANDYLYSYSDLSEVKNRIYRVSLNNNLYFDRNKKYNFSSLISFHEQQGDNEFRKIESNQRLIFQLPKNFRLIGSYNFFDWSDELQGTRQSKIHGEIYHKLYLSLQSKLFADYSTLKRGLSSEYTESNTRFGIDLDYQKKIPFGELNLAYRYFRQHQSTQGKTGIQLIRNEEHVLSDAEIVLLDKPFVDNTSVIVRDQTGTVIYQESFDYMLIERNKFIEIQRVPGGLITNGQAISVDYTAAGPGSQSYDANNHNYSASLLIFRRRLEIYYRGATQGFVNEVNTELLPLNRYTQNVIGTRVDFGFTRAGVEMDLFESNIIPYKLIRYYLDASGRVGKKMLLSFNANVRDYLWIDDEVNRLFANVSGRVSYRFMPQLKLNVDFGYLNQTGHNIDLDALTARMELIANIRQMTIRAGTEFYRRLYVNSTYSLNGAYIQISRKF